MAPVDDGSSSRCRYANLVPRACDPFPPLDKGQQRFWREDCRQYSWRHFYTRIDWNKNGKFANAKIKERFVCSMRDQVNTFDANCFLYHERECVKFLIFELREKVTRETVHCCCVQMYTATLDDFLRVNASYPVLECRKRTGLSW